MATKTNINRQLNDYAHQSARALSSLYMSALELEILHDKMGAINLNAGQSVEDYSFLRGMLAAFFKQAGVDFKNVIPSIKDPQTKTKKKLKTPTTKAKKLK